MKSTGQTDFVMNLTRFEDLDCWKEARQLTWQVYEAIEQDSVWKRDTRLCSQIQSAAGSVMANIDEGFVRRSSKEFVQFLFIAMSSSAEVRSHLYIAVDQGYLSKEAFESIYAQADKVGRIISGLIKYLCTKQTKSTK
jgi:four helix bundle protein